MVRVTLTPFRAAVRQMEVDRGAVAGGGERGRLVVARDRVRAQREGGRGTQARQDRPREYAPRRRQHLGRRLRRTRHRRTRRQRRYVQTRRDERLSLADDSSRRGLGTGAYRSDSGHEVHQLTEAEKESVSAEVKAAAKEMAKVRPFGVRGAKLCGSITHTSPSCARRCCCCCCELLTESAREEAEGDRHDRRRPAALLQLSASCLSAGTCLACLAPPPPCAVRCVRSSLFCSVPFCR